MSGNARLSAAQALTAAREWLAQDPDPVTRAELEQLVLAAQAGDRLAQDGLAERFSGRLEFGTAGLRAQLGAGPRRMNRVVVAHAAAGLAAYLLERRGPASQAPSVVIGYDGRTNSALFARDSAQIMAGAGVRVILLPEALPTPVLAFSVRHLSADAGVMVTASHNPPRDNGYKVYLGGPEHDGSQIVSPVDEEIAAHIARAASAGPIAALPRSDAFQTAGPELREAYLRATAAVAGPVPAQLKVVYTAMHGVGHAVTEEVLRRAGFDPVIAVPEQRDPDPAFPTVDFPNPEEPGALDLAFALAERTGAELVVAQDPDADRLAVAIPTPAGWRRLTGNEVGCLLAWWCAQRHQRAGREGGALACSVVSSPALGAVARHYGLDHVQTLTGFKWISRVPGLIFGYEEALGYLVNPGDVRDKDGVSATVAFLALASTAKAAGQSVADLLDDFARRFGEFASTQLSIRMDPAAISAVIARLRSRPPERIGELQVEQLDDFAGGWGSLPPTEMLRFRLTGGSRVILRPSGTEPKLKVYLDTVAGEHGPSASEALEALERGVRAMLQL